MPRPFAFRLLTSLLLIQCCLIFAEDTVDPGTKLVTALAPLLDVMAGKTDHYTLRAQFTIGGKEGSAEVARIADRDYFIHFKIDKNLEGALSVSPTETRLDIAPKNTTFVGTGALGVDILSPSALLTQASKLSNGAMTALAALKQGDREAMGGALSLFATIQVAETSNGNQTFKIITDKKGGAVQCSVSRGTDQSDWSGEFHFPGGSKEAPTENIVKLSISKSAEHPAPVQGRTEVAVPRDELERSLQRGAMRALEIQNNDLHARAPTDFVFNIPGARLEVSHGQRVCYLTGTPARMGAQHGHLLTKEIRSVVDSTLYVVGMYYSMQTGKWFLAEIRDAWKHLEPNIDKEYLEELNAMADAACVDKEEMQLSNVLPELFHCSGFAVANQATVGGKLFHGRVLDYMTEIGLQHVQVDFIMHPAGKRATVNVGYAGFIGCVTGMNDAQISMGEMGGKGVGKWDGTPMAFLMRRVLENAETLEQARTILEIAKRTCEYYYVIADGKTRTASGVAAWPEKIEFLKQGEAHPLLPNPVKDCVLLSVGKRYEELRQRTQNGFGKLDEAAAMQLMKMPVAMPSNLHCVLFVPEDQIYYAAHAGLRGHKPAAETKYVRHDFKEELKTLEEVNAGK